MEQGKGQKRWQRTHNTAFEAKEALAARKGEKIIDELGDEYSEAHPKAMPKLDNQLRPGR